MKNYFFIAALGLMTLAACQSEALETNQTATATFAVSVTNDAIATRAADANVARYAIAIDGLDLGNGEGAFMIQDNGTFEIPGLITGQQYTAYFWADYDDGTYDVVWPNWVSLKDGKEIGMAYHGHTTFTLGEQDAPYAITLKRAVAQVTLTQKDAAAGTPWIKVHFNRYKVFNAKNGTCSGDAESKKVEYDPAGGFAAGQVLASFYVFAPENGYTSDFVIKNGDDWTDSEEVVHYAPVIATVNNVPLKANYKTNITGNYNTGVLASAQFSVTTDDSWDTPDNGESF